MLFNATKNLIATAQNPHKAPKDVDRARDQLFEATASATKLELTEQMTEIAKHFGLSDVYRGAFLALICGALVEQGCDPQPMAGPLRTQLKTILEACGRLAEACKAKMPATTEKDKDEEAEDDEEQDAHDAAFEEARRQVAPKMQAENNAWESLHTWWRPAVAVYSASEMARMAASSLRPLAQQCAPFHQGAHWLNVMLGIMHEEPILVLEPQTGIGIVGRISGVADNFQLHTLLMESFPSSGIAAGSRVPRSIAEVARGAGPQQTEETVTGFWNLYNWHAVQANGQLPPADDFTHSSVWLWNEAYPVDIPQFEGQRVVLLGPPSIERTWNALRIFEHVPASLKIEKTLSSDEVRGLVQKMAAAKS
ncbi:hypothetical protein [Anatilimnocola floriformis]|uniref:hypothetical protein n=1 Tax=Anatilimnocola floriformis TaxID=2948575 RepID=UPI0020C2857C|nr:hypothetical protein [Anatilimnocola floriformis]